MRLLNKLYKQYQDKNPERFNEDFIMGSRKEDILPYIKDIFKSLEILDEFEVLEVSMDTDEAQFGPIKHEHKTYKSILETRLEKIHYKIRVTPTEIAEDRKILEDGKTDTGHKSIQNADSFIIERDLFVNKLIDGMFYINEDCRYFLVHQLVDASIYGNKNSLSLKSLLMPITLSRKSEGGLTLTSLSGDVYTGIPSYELILFAKKINPLLYVFAKYAYNIYIENKESFTEPSKLQEFRSDEIIESINKFLGTDYEFSDKVEDLVANKDRAAFQISESVYVSVNKKKLEERDQNTISSLGCLFALKGDEKRKKNTMTLDDMKSPLYWMNILSSFFTKNTEQGKKIEKCKTMLISLSRLVDDATRKLLRLKDEDKENSLTIVRYMMREFDELIRLDNCDFETKRLRLYEYVVNPLRMYLSEQIYRILNSPTRSRVVLEKTFSNLKPFYLVRQTVVSELLRYYNATNEMDLYTCLLTYTQTGPQAIGKVVSVESRDVHPSHVGKASLVASNASNPGLSGRLVPFLEIYENGYFTKPEE